MTELLRSKEMAEKYRQHKDSGAMDDICVLCKAESIKEFIYWKIINNNFPYDLLAKQHHMLVPVRHIREDQITAEEYNELLDIKANNLDVYDYIMEATPKAKSVPYHFHLHLIVGKQLK